MVRVPADSYPVGGGRGRPQPLRRPRFLLPRLDRSDGRGLSALPRLDRDRRAVARRARPRTGRRPASCGAKHNASASGAGPGCPTEDEWEAAARGKEGGRYPWGDRWDRGRANAGLMTDTLQPVGAFPLGRSPSGREDMVGNAWEWTAADTVMPQRTGPARDQGRGVQHAAGERRGHLPHRSPRRPPAPLEHRLPVRTIRRADRWPVSRRVGSLACQPASPPPAAARRSASRKPAELDATARPWRDAGYHVDYRRYYPHLTREDLERYRVVMVLGGRGPTAGIRRPGRRRPRHPHGMDAAGRCGRARLPSGRRRRFRPLVDESVARLERSGHHHRRLRRAQRGLRPESAAARAAGAHGRPAGHRLRPVSGGREQRRCWWTTKRRHSPAPGRAPSCRGRVSTPSGAATFQSWRPAASGTVWSSSLSRSALGAVGDGDTLSGEVPRPAAGAGTRAFLVALARFTRRPAEWARIPTAGARVAAAARRRPAARAATPSTRAAAPSGVSVERLAQRAPPPLPATTGVPPGSRARDSAPWKGTFPRSHQRRPGRPARLAALDSLTTMLDVGAFNLLVTNAHAGPAGGFGRWADDWERDALRAAWQQVAGRLQATSVRWIPLVLPRDLASPDGQCASEPPVRSTRPSGAGSPRASACWRVSPPSIAT